jgi:hypothetical protein
LREYNREANRNRPGSKHAGAKLRSMAKVLGSRRILADGKGSAGSHVSGLLKGFGDRQAAMGVVKELPAGELDAAAIAPVEGEADGGVAAVADSSDVQGLANPVLNDFDGRR